MFEMKHCEMVVTSECECENYKMIGYDRNWESKEKKKWNDGKSNSYNKLMDN